jgi:aspartate/methionine/tyrosine aminotransferase
VTLSQGTEAWHLDLDQLFDSCGPKTRAIFINSPNNPTGWVIEPEDMIRIRDFARARGLWIIADEVYGQFIYDRPRTTSFLEITTPEDRLMVTNTFSKNWSMTGWRVGWVVLPQSAALAQAHENIVQYSTSGVATFLQYGCIAALNQGDSYVKHMVEQSRQGRDLVCAQLGELPRVHLARPQGAFYVFFRVEGEADSHALARRLIDEANVGLAPGQAFGAGGAGFLRLCFAASQDTLQAGVGRLIEVLQ